jgi:hypothetical protein
VVAAQLARGYGLAAMPVPEGPFPAVHAWPSWVFEQAAAALFAEFRAYESEWWRAPEPNGEQAALDLSREPPPDLARWCEDRAAYRDEAWQRARQLSAEPRSTAWQYAARARVLTGDHDDPDFVSAMDRYAACVARSYGVPQVLAAVGGGHQANAWPDAVWSAVVDAMAANAATCGDWHLYDDQLDGLDTGWRDAQGGEDVSWDGDDIRPY